MSSEAFNLLKSHIRAPLNLVDVGGRYGSLEFWEKFGDKAHTFCFEGDAEEVARLNSENKSPTVEYLPYAVADKPGRVEIIITEGPGCSSIYMPIKSLYERHRQTIMRPVRSVTCDATTLDAYFQQRGVPKIHGMKLDTQGSELGILRGAENLLKGCVFIVVETEFNAMYEGQPLFCDVDRFLRDRGFTLWRLNNLAHYSTDIVSGDSHPILLSVEPGDYQFIHIDNGQLFWADALYVKEAAVPTNDATLSLDDAIAGACLVGQWGLWDLAIEMIRKSGAKDLLSELQALLPVRSPRPTLVHENNALRAQVEVLKAELAQAKAAA